MSEMKRPALEYANLPDIPVSQMTPAQQLICKVAWISDNAAHGTLYAAKRLIDDIKAGYFSRVVTNELSLTEDQLWRMVLTYHGWKDDNEMVEAVGYNLELYVERMRRAIKSIHQS